MTTSATQPADQIRKTFLDFFAARGHAAVPSATIVPQNDPTLMFVNAGMVPFKNVFTGQDKRPYTRATSSQKCIRISGKHNDLENVGVTARHHTFFEMLGNFSFGDYFKEDAIAFAWELLTKVYGIPENRLVITVFKGEGGFTADDEAAAIWRRVTGFGDERIIRLGMADNFWSMGDTGPCGPCSEIHFFHGGEPDLARFGEEPRIDGSGWTEIWNLVFMQYDRASKDAPVTPLPAPSIDTGMGLERVSAVLQGVTSNYDTDLLRGLVDHAAAIAGKPYTGGTGPDDVSMRVIADHARTTAFMIAEGILPDRDGREYVLRRVMRRAIRHGHRLGITRPFLHEVALDVVRGMGAAYPELVDRKDLIAKVAEAEEVRFRETIDRGLELIEKNKVWRMEGEQRVMPGATAFKLHDTYGFPLDLTQVIGQEQGFSVDIAEYEQELAEARARSAGSKVGEEAVDAIFAPVLAKVKSVAFTGYEREEGTSEVAGLILVEESGEGDKIKRARRAVDQASAGSKVEIVVKETPFYGESGGQVGDIGVFTAEGLRVRITDTQKPISGLIVHEGVVEEGSIAIGQKVHLAVDHAARSATRRNHSATHLLHWALRTVMGDHAQQKGSRVGPDILRFDFTHNSPLSREQIGKIEDLVNDKVLSNAPVLTEVLPIDEARKKGAMAIFEEKYGDTVRMLTMTPEVVELCGGTHARALGDIGLFKITGEGGVAAGVRRITAVTGVNALSHLREVEAELHRARQAAKATGGDLVDKIGKLVARERELEKKVAEAEKKLLEGGGGGQGSGIDGMIAAAEEVQGIKVLGRRVPDGTQAAALRELCEKLRDKLGDKAVVLLGSVTDGKAQLVAMVSKEATAKVKAGDLIKNVSAIVGGRGGGRPDMAQAGGPDVSKLDEAIAETRAEVEKLAGG
ncbi:MAG: alanine--tRNA ligase [Byssovorax sp.]